MLMQIDFFSMEALPSTITFQKTAWVESVGQFDTNWRENCMTQRAKSHEAKLMEDKLLISSIQGVYAAEDRRLK